MIVKMGKSSGIKLFVGGIDPETTKESMQAYFEQFTCVIHCKVETGKKLRLSKGFGYVTVPNLRIVEWLLSFEHHIDGKKVDIEVAIKKPKKVKQYALAYEETPPFKYGIYNLETGLTSNYNRPIKSFLDIGSSNLSGYIMTDQSAHEVFSPKLELDQTKFHPSIPKTSPYEGSLNFSPPIQETAQERKSSKWPSPLRPEEQSYVPNFSRVICTPDCGLPERAKTKHSKYEFISDRLNEAAVNYRFNKRREAGFHSPAQLR